MNILLVSHLFRRQLSGGEFKAWMLRLLPYAYFLAFTGGIAFATHKLVGIDSLGAKTIALLLVLACGLSLAASYLSIARIAKAPASDMTGVGTAEPLRVSWRIYEAICFTPILILALLSMASFLKS